MKLPQLGEDAGAIVFDSSEELSTHTLALLQQCNHQVQIFTHDLESRLYNRAEILDAFSRLARRSRLSRIEILVFEPGVAVREHNRLIELYRRMTEYIAIRQVHADYLQDPTAFALFDGKGIIYRPQHALYHGYADYYALYEVLEKQKYFQEIWEKSVPVQEFQRLYI
ncbi:MAG: hypothetical protein HYV16_05060 [Gammaproteobacteria bacterium]|nr:hypothetical protein [Gammaproteobacteria bacterium]